MNKEEIINKYKLHKLKLQHCVASFCKKINISYILFAISIVLFSAVLIPSLGQQLPFYDVLFQVGSFSTKRTIDGVVWTSNTRETDTDDKVPAGFARIYSGGYVTQSNERGHFSLHITSPSTKAIPLIVEYQGVTYLFWADFEHNLYILNQEYYLNEKSRI